MVNGMTNIILMFCTMIDPQPHCHHGSSSFAGGGHRFRRLPCHGHRVQWLLGGDTDGRLTRTKRRLNLEKCGLNQQRYGSNMI